MNYKDEQIEKFRWEFSEHLHFDNETDDWFIPRLEQFLIESMERAYLKGKLTAYENVVAWTEQCDPSNEMALSAHRAAVSSTEDDLTQSGEKE